jgi:hypothetical protein
VRVAKAQEMSQDSGKVPMEYILFSHDKVATESQKQCISQRMTSFTNQPCLLGFSALFLPYAGYNIVQGVRYRNATLKAGAAAQSIPPIPRGISTVSPAALIIVYVSAIVSDILINRIQCYSTNDKNTNQ